MSTQPVINRRVSPKAYKRSRRSTSADMIQRSAAARSMNLAAARAATSVNVVPEVVKRYVRRSIKSSQEPKQFVNYGNNTALVNSGATGGWNYVTIIPSIAQGTSEATRIGNKITISSLQLRMHIHNNVYNASSNPAYHNSYRIIVFSFYKQNSFTTGDLASLFDVGSTGVSWQGNVLDTLLSTNSDMFKVYYDKVVHLASPKDTDVNTSRPSDANVDVDCTKFVPKNWKFDDATTAPTNCNLYCLISGVPSDCATGAVTSTNIGRFSYVVDCRYTDA